MKIGVLLIDTGTPASTASQEDLLGFAQAIYGNGYCAQYLDFISKNMLERVTLPAKARRWHKRFVNAADNPSRDYARTAHALVEQLNARLSDELTSASTVAIGMICGIPSIEDAARELVEHQCDTIILTPLLPFYFKPLLAPALKRAEIALERTSDNEQKLRITRSSWLCENPEYRRLLVKLIEQDWDTRSSSRLLVLMPSQPKAINEEDNTYVKQIKEFQEYLNKKLDIGSNRIQISYICDFDNNKWMGPFAEKTLLGWAGGAVNDVRAICPAFTDKSLYVISEAGERLHEYYLSNSFGLSLEYTLVPNMNDSAAFIDVLSSVIQRRIRKL